MSTGPTSAETTALLLESPRRLSIEDYHRMIETRILGEDERVELLEYARFGILEYWLVDVEHETVEAFADPDPSAGAYRRFRALGKDESLASDALPGVSFPARDLFN